MDKTGSTSQLAPKSIHRQFFQWAVKWFYSNQSENISTKPDIPSIICLLQAIGFKLQKFEKSEQLISIDDVLKDENIRITMECGTSKMIAILEMDNVKCECPTNDVANDGSLWSIIGTEPIRSTDNTNKIEETGSNLLPEMSKDATNVVRDVVYRLFKIINNKADINQNTDSNMNLPDLSGNNTITKGAELKEGLIRSYTDYYDQNYKPLTSSKLNSTLSSCKFNSTKSIKDSILAEKPQLQRQGTYDLEKDNESIDEPRPSPPKLASSPVIHQLCTSLGQISLQSDDEIVGLADYVVKAHQILDKAVNFIMKKIPLSSSHSSIQDDSNFVKPLAPPLMSSSFTLGSPRSSCSGSLINRSTSSMISSRPGSSCSMPAQPTQSVTRPIPIVQKPAARRGVGTVVGTAPAGLNTTRERSSSFNIPSRVPQPLTKTNVAANSNAKRKSTTNITTMGLAQRTTPTISKVQTGKPKPVNNLTVEKTNTAMKRRISSDTKNSSTLSSTEQRANVSLIKAPSRISIGASSTKFGFAKK